MWSISYRLSYLAGSKRVSARPPVSPPVRPGYDDKYRYRSYRFVERQKSFLKVSEIFKANRFVTAAAAAEADIGDNI